MVVLHIGANDLKSKQNPVDIANETINLATNIKSNGMGLPISSLIPRGHRLSKKLTKSYKKNVVQRTMLLYYIKI